mgnify:CR=1 FL=1
MFASAREVKLVVIALRISITGPSGADPSRPEMPRWRIMDPTTPRRRAARKCARYMRRTLTCIVTTWRALAHVMGATSGHRATITQPHDAARPLVSGPHPAAQCTGQAVSRPARGYFKAARGLHLFPSCCALWAAPCNFAECKRQTHRSLTLGLWIAPTPDTPLRIGSLDPQTKALGLLQGVPGFRHR